MQRFFSILTIFILAFGLTACQKNSAETKIPAEKPAQPAINSPTATPESKVKTYNGKGVVTKIDLKLVSVELNHEEIKGLMPAMIMEFYVKEKSELEVLKVGDKVDFVLEDNAGAERIVSIKKAE